MASRLQLPQMIAEEAVMAALAEDLGQAGDITTDAVFGEDDEGEAAIVARQDGIIAGLDLAELAFTALDAHASFERIIEDGDAVRAGESIASIAGRARALLTAERTALNFLGHLSGVATLTAKFVDAVSGTKAQIVDTRKTLPGLRALQKYAVRAGGGRNHRFGLYDAVLVKDNHIAAAGGIAEACHAIRSIVGHAVRIEVEVDRIDQLEVLLRAPTDAVLLDNMDPETLARAVDMVAGRMITEASGGVSLETVRGIAETGVDLISVGALTHSTRNLDLSLEWKR